MNYFVLDVTCFKGLSVLCQLEKMVGTWKLVVEMLKWKV